jgi:trans-aconitate methyltransferase
MPRMCQHSVMNEFADSVIQLYDRHAIDWAADRNRPGGPWIDKAWIERFAAMLPDRGASLLDIGCGSGAPIATFLAMRGCRITGVDSSPTLISLCRQRLPDHEWLVGDMRSLELSRSFDGVLAWDSFFHLTQDDQRRMFDVFSRHAAPGTMLIFNTGPAFGESIGSYRGEPLYHASLDQSEYTALLQNIDFEVIAHQAEDWETGGGRTVWIARRVPA